MLDPGEQMQTGGEVTQVTRATLRKVVTFRCRRDTSAAPTPGKQPSVILDNRQAKAWLRRASQGVLTGTRQAAFVVGQKGLGFGTAHIAFERSPIAVQQIHHDEAVEGIAEVRVNVERQHLAAQP